MQECRNCKEEMEYESMFCNECDENQFLHCEKCGKITNKHTYSKKNGGMICSDGCKREYH